LLATLGGFFGVLALVLAAVGLYGVVAYGTARRAREIGIRIVFGARWRAVVWMVARDALGLVAAGLAIGLPVSYAAARQVHSLLCGVQPLDAVTRRAATLDPLAVLRRD
jgi:ABC-type antimicrobial peptide transport system permease subunit